MVVNVIPGIDVKIVAQNYIGENKWMTVNGFYIQQEWHLPI